MGRQLRTRPEDVEGELEVAVLGGQREGLSQSGGVDLCGNAVVEQSRFGQEQVLGGLPADSPGVRLGGGVVQGQLDLSLNASHLRVEERHDACL